MTNSPIRVMIADDHPTMRQGLQILLAEVPRIEVVGVVRSFCEVDERLRRVSADVLILDVLGMGGSSLATVSGLRRNYPTLKVIVFSSTVGLAPELIRAGAHGYMTKEEMFDDLVQAIIEVHAGGTFYSENVREYVERTRRRHDFTDREHLLLRMNERGKSTLEMVEYTGLSRGTIDNYFSRLYEKTGTTDRASLSRWYRDEYGEL